MKSKLKATPLCPSCGRPMRLARTIPALGGLPELRTYDCRQCGVTLTEADDDPTVATWANVLEPA